MIDRPAADPARQTEMLKRARSELTRLLLGLIAGASAALPVTYSYAGAAESPDGTAHALDVAGPDDFKARLFVDTSTHLPLMLVYTELEPRVVRMMSPRSGASRSAGGGAAHGAPLTPEQRAEIDKQLREEEGTRKEIEMRMFFADYRAVGGILLPHRITRGTAAATTEEWEVKEFKVNPAIKADRFKVGTEQP